MGLFRKKSKGPKETINTMPDDDPPPSDENNRASRGSDSQKSKEDSSDEEDASPKLDSPTLSKSEKRKSFFDSWKKSKGNPTKRESTGSPSSARGLKPQISRVFDESGNAQHIIHLPPIAKTPEYLETCSSMFGEDVPQNVLMRILEFAAGEAKTVCRALQVSKSWCLAGEKEEVWASLLQAITIGQGERKPIWCKTPRQAYATIFNRINRRKAKEAAGQAEPPSPTVKKPVATASYYDKLKFLGLADEGSFRAPVVVAAAPSAPIFMELPRQPDGRAPPRPHTLKAGELDPTDFYMCDYRFLKNKEEEDSPENITYSPNKKEIEAATLDKLVEVLTSHKSYEQNFLHTFMITYRSFTNPEKLFEKLVERWNLPPPDVSENYDFSTFKKEKLDRIRLRVTQTIKFWLENFFNFDYDEILLETFEEFMEETMMKTKGESLSKMLHNTYEKILAGDDGKVQSVFERPKILYPKRFTKSVPVPVLKWPLTEIARQISLTDFSWFVKIQPKECLNQSWNKESRAEKAPNIFGMITWFNKLSNWIGSVIVKEADLDKRVKTLSKCIQLAGECSQLNNFNAVYAIISGLNLASIHRLRKTWDELEESDQKLYEELYELISRERNFKNVRTRIKTAKPPCIPYIGLYLTDLTFIEDGHPKYIGNKINFLKCLQFAGVIRDIQTYQNTKYEFDKVPELTQQLNALEVLSEEEMYNESLAREERVKKSRKKKAVSDSNGGNNDDDE